jgi:hypothetical protein
MTHGTASFDGSLLLVKGSVETSYKTQWLSNVTGGSPQNRYTEFVRFDQKVKTSAAHRSFRRQGAVANPVMVVGEPARTAKRSPPQPVALVAAFVKGRALLNASDVAAMR